MPSFTDLPQQQPPHVALLPSAGMGLLTPNLRLAAMLASHNCRVTLIAPRPTVSAAESDHISAFLHAYPSIHNLDFQIVPYTPPQPADPFFVQMHSINQSAHLLTPILSSMSPPLSAIISDIATCIGLCDVAADLGIQHYILATTCARFTALASRVPYINAPESSITVTETALHIPGLAPFDISTIPPPFFMPNHIFNSLVVSTGLALTKAKGILVNTFHAFEPDTIEAINGRKVIPDLPPFLPIGPLQPHNLVVGDQITHQISWLDQQPPMSVVYVCFGNRTALTRDQIVELGKGLEKSGQRFFWVVKSTTVDKQDTEELEDLVGAEFVKRTKERGMVVKGWVNQEKILSHMAIGGYVSHCGWNSMTEAATRGIPVLAWPPNGDNRMVAEIAVTAGLGVWEKKWGWWGEQLVKGEEIAETVRMVMTDDKLRETARKIGVEASNAIKVGGSSYKVMEEIILSLQHKHGTNLNKDDNSS